MEEFFTAIEKKISESGYSGRVDGEALYDEICDEIEDKENGSYLFLSKQANGDLFEYKVDVMDENFNLSSLRISTENQTYLIDFDA